MKPLLKWLLAALALLLLASIAVVVAVFTLVDPAEYRRGVIDAVQHATGRTLALDGDVGLKLFPCCAVELEQVALGNPPGFPADPFVRVESARLAIRLWPLLTRREVEIGTVGLKGLTASLIGRKDGSNNWSFSDTASSTAAEGAGTGTTDVAGISVAGISISNARIDYSDEADNTRYRVENLELTTGPFRDGAAFDLSTSFRLTNLRDNSGGDLKLKARTSVAVDGEVTTVQLTDLDTDLDTTGLGGLKALSGRVRAPNLEVRISSDTMVSAPKLSADLKLKGPDLPGGAAALEATLAGFSYDVDAGGGAISGLTAKTTLAGVAVDLTGAGTFGATNSLRGTVRLPEVSPRELLASMQKPPPEAADSNVLKKLSGSADWFVQEKSAGLDKLALVLDDTKIGGSLSQELLPAGSKATPRSRFDLTLDTVNADRYLAPEKAPAPKGENGKRAKQPPTEIPSEPLRNLNLEGRARIGQLTIDGMRLADVDVMANAAGGRLRLEPLAAKLYGGSFRGGIRVDATGAKPRVTLDQNFTGVDFGALLAAFADVKNITGIMSLKLDGSAVGGTDDEMLENLAGNLSFTLADGVYKGMDVWHEIRKAHALLKRTEPPARSGPEQTQIKALDLAGKISDGKLRTDRFTAEIPFLRVSGDTTVDLPKSTLDSKLTALVFEKPVFGDDTSLEDLENVRIPFTVSGPIEDPKVRVDLGKMVKGALKETVREKLADKLRDKLGLGSGQGQPAEEAPPADGEQPAPAPEKKKEDAVKKALDRLFR